MQSRSEKARLRFNSKCEEWCEEKYDVHDVQKMSKVNDLNVQPCLSAIAADPPLPNRL